MILSIIIPTLNEEQTLALLLKDIFAQSFKDFEVLIADAGSVDKTIEVAENFNTKLVKGGIAAIGRNNGAKIAKGDWLLFLDADMRLNKTTYLQESIDQIKSQKLKMAHSRYLLPNKNIGLKFIYILSDYPKEIFQYTPYAFCSGNCIWIDKNTFEEVGGFPQIKIAEDQKFAWEVTKRGNKFRLLKNKLVPNTRRYENNSVIAVAFAFWLGSILPKNDSNMRKWVNKIYGEFGKYKK